MSSNYEIIYDFLTQPKIAIAKIKVERPWLLSFLVVTFALFTQTVSVLQFFMLGAKFTFFSLSIFFLLRLLLVYIIWFFLTALFHSLAQFLGGQGRVEELFLSLGFSFLPIFFLLPVSTLSHFFLVQQTFITGWQVFLFYYFLNLFLFFWIFCLQILSIKEVYSLPLGRAVAVYSLPFLFLLMIIGVVIMVLVFSLVSLVR